MVQSGNEAVDLVHRQPDQAHSWKVRMAFFPIVRQSNLGQKKWRQWPVIVVSLDQGSDGMCACFSLEYHFKICMLKLPDWSHGGNKDLQVGVKMVGWWDWLLLWLISANVNHGPDKDDQRYHEMGDGMKVAYAEITEHNPVFQSHQPEIYEELVANGYQFPREQSEARETFEACAAIAPYGKKGYRLNLNRFQGLSRLQKRSHCLIGIATLGSGVL